MMVVCEELLDATVESGEMNGPPTNHPRIDATDLKRASEPSNVTGLDAIWVGTTW